MRTKKVFTIRIIVVIATQWIIPLSYAKKKSRNWQYDYQDYCHDPRDDPKYINTYTMVQTIRTQFYDWDTGDTEIRIGVPKSVALLIGQAILKRENGQNGIIPQLTKWQSIHLTVVEVLAVQENYISTGTNPNLFLWSLSKPFLVDNVNLISILFGGKRK